MNITNFNKDLSSIYLISSRPIKKNISFLSFSMRLNYINGLFKVIRINFIATLSHCHLIQQLQ